MRIIADPRFGVHYLSYYIYGIKELGISFTFAVIEDVPLSTLTQLRKGMPFLADDRMKVFIDPNDGADIDEDFYNWCDVYAKINVSKEDAERNKILAIGPSFGVRLWNPLMSVVIGVSNYLKAKRSKGITLPFTSFMKSYFYLIYRRLPYIEYKRFLEEDENYVFTMNTLWYDHFTDMTTNRMRGIFAKICKKIMPKFEGGFFYVDSPSVVKEFPEYTRYLEVYSDILTKKRVKMREYMRKIKQSVMVFNAPAVEACHGWKLGEYLAMGKAIISVPLTREMPGEFKPGEHYLQIENEAEMENAIISLKQNKELRENLKTNASLYFESYLEPKSVVKRIFKI